MTSSDLLLGAAVVALGFLALWSQFGRRVTLQVAFIAVGSLAIFGAMWITAVIAAWLIDRPLVAAGFALGFLLGVALVLLVGALIAGDLNKDRGGDAVE